MNNNTGLAFGTSFSGTFPAQGSRIASSAARRIAAAAFTLGATATLSGLLTGCGMNGSLGGKTGTGVTASSVHFTGNVHGGQQPVTNSTIQLYTVGTSGLKSAATPLIAQTVTTDSGGNFTITGDYSCSSASQVYITATGGNPGAGNNSALTLVAALGSCSSLSASTFIVINEVTTVAAAYALAPFTADITHVGATGTNPVGLVNAFGNAAVLSNVTSGTAAGANLGTGVTVPVAELNTLGNILASCVNSTGSASTGCSALFSATAATETFGAAVAIAKNPGAPAVVSLYSQSSAAAPFQPSLATQPNDFTVAVTSTGGGVLATPYGVAIDAAGNAWVANESGTSVTELSNAAAAIANVTSTGLYGPQGVALDRSGNVWVANTAGNSVVKFTLTGGAVTGSASYTAGGVNAPSAIAIDSAGNAAVANFNGNSVSILSAAGAALSGSPFAGSAGNITVPTGVAYGPAGDLYVASGNGSVVKLSNAGTYVAAFNDGSLQGAAAVAVDAQTHVVATGYTSGTAVGPGLSEFNSIGTAVASSPQTSGLNAPAGVASDGTNLFIANSATGGSLAEYAYGSSTPMSPTSGYGSLNTPIGVAVDASGCVWTTNSGSNTVSKFIGLSLPVTTPLAANVGP